MVLYILIFLIFYHLPIFVKPSAVLIQLVIVYIVVYEFRRMDFSELTQSSYQ